jgi:hypothetical protein
MRAWWEIVSLCIRGLRWRMCATDMSLAPRYTGDNYILAYGGCGFGHYWSPRAVPLGTVPDINCRSRHGRF